MIGLTGAAHPRVRPSDHWVCTVESPCGLAARNVRPGEICDAQGFGHAATKVRTVDQDLGDRRWYLAVSEVIQIPFREVFHIRAARISGEERRLTSKLG